MMMDSDDSLEMELVIDTGAPNKDPVSSDEFSTEKSEEEPETEDYNASTGSENQSARENQITFLKQRKCLLLNRLKTHAMPCHAPVEPPSDEAAKRYFLRSGEPKQYAFALKSDSERTESTMSDCIYSDNDVKNPSLTACADEDRDAGGTGCEADDDGDANATVSGVHSEEVTEDNSGAVCNQIPNENNSSNENHSSNGNMESTSDNRNSIRNSNQNSNSPDASPIDNNVVKSLLVDSIVNRSFCASSKKQPSPTRSNNDLDDKCPEDIVERAAEDNLEFSGSSTEIPSESDNSLKEDDNVVFSIPDNYNDMFPSEEENAATEEPDATTCEVNPPKYSDVDLKDDGNDNDHVTTDGNDITNADADTIHVDKIKITITNIDEKDIGTADHVNEIVTNVIDENNNTKSVGQEVAPDSMDDTSITSQVKSDMPADPNMELSALKSLPDYEVVKRCDENATTDTTVPGEPTVQPASGSQRENTLKAYRKKYNVKRKKKGKMKNKRKPMIVNDLRDILSKPSKEAVPLMAVKVKTPRNSEQELARLKAAISDDNGGEDEPEQSCVDRPVTLDPSSTAEIPHIEPAQELRVVKPIIQAKHITEYFHGERESCSMLRTYDCSKPTKIDPRLRTTNVNVVEPKIAIPPIVEHDSLTTLKPDNLLSVKPESLTTMTIDHLATLKPESLATPKPESLITLKPESLTPLKPESLATLNPESLITLKSESLTPLKHEGLATVTHNSPTIVKPVTENESLPLFYCHCGRGFEEKSALSVHHVKFHQRNNKNTTFIEDPYVLVKPMKNTPSCGRKLSTKLKTEASDHDDDDDTDDQSGVINLQGIDVQKLCNDLLKLRGKGRGKMVRKSIGPKFRMKRTMPPSRDVQSHTPSDVVNMKTSPLRSPSMTRRRLGPKCSMTQVMKVNDYSPSSADVVSPSRSKIKKKVLLGPKCRIKRATFDNSESSAPPDAAEMAVPPMKTLNKFKIKQAMPLKNDTQPGAPSGGADVSLAQLGGTLNKRTVLSPSPRYRSKQEQKTAEYSESDEPLWGGDVPAPPLTDNVPSLVLSGDDDSSKIDDDDSSVSGFSVSILGPYASNSGLDTSIGGSSVMGELFGDISESSDSDVNVSRTLSVANLSMFKSSNASSKKQPTESGKLKRLIAMKRNDLDLDNQVVDPNDQRTVSPLKIRLNGAKLERIEKTAVEKTFRKADELECLEANSKDILIVVEDMEAKAGTTSPACDAETLPLDTGVDNTEERHRPSPFDELPKATTCQTKIQSMSSVADDGVYSPTDRVNSPTDRVNSPTDGVDSPTDGVNSPTDGVNSPTNVSDEIINNSQEVMESSLVLTGTMKISDMKKKRKPAHTRTTIDDTNMVLAAATKVTTPSLLKQERKRKVVENTSNMVEDNEQPQSGVVPDEHHTLRRTPEKRVLTEPSTQLLGGSCEQNPMSSSFEQHSLTASFEQHPLSESSEQRLLAEPPEQHVGALSEHPPITGSSEQHHLGTSLEQHSMGESSEPLTIESLTAELLAVYDEAEPPPRKRPRPFRRHLDDMDNLGAEVPDYFRCDASNVIEQCRTATSNRTSPPAVPELHSGGSLRDDLHRSLPGGPRRRHIPDLRSKIESHRSRRSHDGVPDGRMQSSRSRSPPRSHYRRSRSRSRRSRSRSRSRSQKAVSRGPRSPHRTDRPSLRHSRSPTRFRKSPSHLRRPSNLPPHGQPRSSIRTIGKHDMDPPKMPRDGSRSDVRSRRETPAPAGGKRGEKRKSSRDPTRTQWNSNTIPVNRSPAGQSNTSSNDDASKIQQQCIYCDEIIDDKFRYQHLSRNHRYRCFRCKITFPTKAEKIDHCVNAHDHLVCVPCDTDFISKALFEQHQTTKCHLEMVRIQQNRELKKSRKESQKTGKNRKHSTSTRSVQSPRSTSTRPDKSPRSTSTRSDKSPLKSMKSIKPSSVPKYEKYPENTKAEDLYNKIKSNDRTLQDSRSSAKQRGYSPRNSRDRQRRSHDCTEPWSRDKSAASRDLEQRNPQRSRNILERSPESSPEPRPKQRSQPSPEPPADKSDKLIAELITSIKHNPSTAEKFVSLFKGLGGAFSSTPAAPPPTAPQPQHPPHPPHAQSWPECSTMAQQNTFARMQRLHASIPQYGTQGGAMSYPPHVQQNHYPEVMQQPYSSYQSYLNTEQPIQQPIHQPIHQPNPQPIQQPIHQTYADNSTMVQDEFYPPCNDRNSAPWMESGSGPPSNSSIHTPRSRTSNFSLNSFESPNATFSGNVYAQSQPVMVGSAESFLNMLDPGLPENHSSRQQYAIKDENNPAQTSRNPHASNRDSHRNSGDNRESLNSSGNHPMSSSTEVFSALNTLQTEEIMDLNICE